MSERAVPVSPEERERQRTVLGALFAASPLKLTPAAASIGVSASQLSRYLSGDTILPTPTYEAVARTFGLPRDELALRLLGLGPAADPDWDLRAALDAILPTDPRYAAKLAEDYEREPIAVQKAMVRFIRDLIAAGRFSVPPEHANCAPTRSDNPHIAEREAYAM